MTKWSRGSQRTRLNALSVEVVCGVTNRVVIYTFLNVHLAFSPGLARGTLLRKGEEEGVGDTLAGRRTQRQLDVNY